LSVIEDLPSPSRQPEPIPVRIGATRAGPARTVVLRKDNWWLQPLVTGLGLFGFVVYATWAAFRNGNYFVGLDQARNYLSPFYSPCLAANCPSAVRWGPITPSSWTVSPAIFILIFPLGFRLTCYYYRKSYYRSFWLSPPACAVADAGSAKPNGLRKRYTGESRFPLVLQNIHRYFWYFTLVFACLLTYDAIEAFRFPGGVGMGIGTVILVVNAVFIWAYQLGCHACRHLTGGNLRKFSKAPVRLWIWTNLTTPLNKHHQLFAWLSLGSIVASDLYIYLVASGTFADPRIF
jgi:hypothetical protein